MKWLGGAFFITFFSCQTSADSTVPLVLTENYATFDCALLEEVRVDQSIQRHLVPLNG